MLVGAYTYFWYSGQWLHKTPHEADPPVLGEYDNANNMGVVASQAKSMAEAGIDFAAISWDGACYDNIVGTLGENGVKSCFLYESLIRCNHSKKVSQASHETVLRDMRALKEDMASPTYLRIDGRPVLVLYVTRVYEQAHVLVPAIRKELGDVWIVGDELFWGEVHRDKLRLFDAVTAYNFYQPKRFDQANPCETFNAAVRDMMLRHADACAGAGVKLWPVAMPGYDDSKIRPVCKHPPIPRMNGDFFARQLEMAKGHVMGEVAMVTSYDEHFEGTGIEPMSSYGDKYLKMVKDFRAK